MLDFGKHGIKKKKKELRALGTHAEKKVNFAIFRAIIIAVVLVCVIGVSAVYGAVDSIIDDAPQITKEQVYPKLYKSYVYDASGNLVDEIIGAQSNRIDQKIENMPECLKRAFIDLEDSRFYEHNGIDVQGIIRAAVSALTSKTLSQGASTITQQLLKISIFEGGAEASDILRVKRKLQEQYLALNLEKSMSKDEILEAYLNTINLGSGCYGVEAAANYYFEKTTDQLTINESAILAAIAQSPTNMNPVKYPEKNRNRRNICLKDMFEAGHITEAEYNEAVADVDIYNRIAEIAQANDNAKTVSTYYTEAAIRRLILDLKNKYGYTGEEASNLVYSGGIRIILAQDPNLQSIVNRYYADDANFSSTEYYPSWALSYLQEDGTIKEYSSSTSGQLLDFYGKPLLFPTKEACFDIVEQYKAYMGFNEKNIIAEYCYAIPQVQSSFVLMDQHNGYVKAMIGGRGEKTSNWALNRATQSTRQPGSVFKIVSVYAAALDTGAVTLATSREDAVYQSWTGATINNVDHSYEGSCTVRRAITVSKNTIATRVLNQDISPNIALDYLIDKFHFSTLDRTQDAVEVLALGGITYGVTNYELTAAVAAVANGGVYNTPVLYTKVLDKDGNVIIDNSVPESNRAIKETTAWLLTSAMCDVVKYGTGTATVLGNGMAQAGKTGTTDNRKDLWYLGFTPYYTAGIWFGYDNNVSMTYRLSSYYAQQKIWRNIMREAHEGLEVIPDFPAPDGITTATVCRWSGKLPSQYCETITEYFDSEFLPTEYCTDHIVVEVCSECGGLCTDDTPDELRVKKSFNSEEDIPTLPCIHIKEETTETPDGSGTTDPSSGTTTSE